MSKTVTIAKKNDIPEGGAKAFEVEGKSIAVFCVDGGYYAIDNSCTHDGGPLSEGALGGEVVICPWHDAEFNVKTGEALCLPATENAKRYEVLESGEELQIEIE